MRKLQHNAQHGLFSVLLSNAPAGVLASLVLGSIAGLAYSCVIPLVLQSLQQPGRGSSASSTFVLHFGGRELPAPAIFLSLCLFVLVTRVASVTLLAHVTTDAMVDLRKRLYRRITQAPIQVLEQIGSARLLSALTTDVPKVVEGAALLPGIFISAATVVGLLGYLIYLDWNIFVFVMGAIVVGIVTYRIPFFFGERCYLRARERFDHLQEGMRGLIFGAKELKLDRMKREDFLAGELHLHENLYAGMQKRGDTLMIFATGYGDLICFFVIGIVTYGLASRFGLGTQATVGVVMALLYISSPLGVILNSIAPVMKGAIALRRIASLLDSLPIERSWQQQGRIDCQQLTLRGVSYRYPPPPKEERGFQVGPVDLDIRRGEVTFIVGGNGSGKSTLGKLLSLHYLPNAGQICFDGTAVTDLNREQCRQSIGAVYSDFHLFSRLFLDGERLAGAQQAIQRYLVELALHDKVQIDGGKFSTLALSDGQRRRLALLVTLLEERSIYVFDEWTADQDPRSREAFYTRILPQLKLMQKIVIVISHDDRYFPKADRVLRMHDGQLVGQSVTCAALPASAGLE